ncbi:DUF6352 family protein [Paucibacter sp. AS339]|uniref:DUF6352 family protein n=1 Tax=Paucibacter hankyongi TaxID=3133434 RepID=UPI003099BE8B
MNLLFPLPPESAGVGAAPIQPANPLHLFWQLGASSALPLNSQGWLRPDAAFLALFLRRPELALLPESCAAEIALHRVLSANPTLAVAGDQLAAIEDEDARGNFQMFLAFRDALVAAGSLEAYYLAVLRSARVTVPPLFLDCLVATVVGYLQRDTADAFQVRAGQLLYREQRVSRSEGRTLCVDLEALDRRQAQTLTQTNSAAGLLDVLSPDNAAEFWRQGESALYALDLTHELSKDLAHGLSFRLTRNHSGLKALSQVLMQWLSHFFQVIENESLTIQPLQQVDDPAWRWHIGLDVEAMRLLNDLYEERSVDADHLERLLSLFRLDAPARFAKPVYLGLATRADMSLKLKPQNLLLNLPPDWALRG